MGDKANQHYVPKFYFRYFSKDGKSICVLNKKNGHLIDSASIKGQASKKYYYGNTEIENLLGKMEYYFALALNKVKNSATLETIDTRDYLLLLQNLMLQRTRTQSARITHQPSVDWIEQTFAEMHIANDETISDDEKERLINEARKLKGNPVDYQIKTMKIATENSKALLDLEPLFLINKTNRPFIFSDAPVILTNPLYKKITLRGVLGASTPGLIVLYPLGPNVCLMLLDLLAYKVKKHKSIKLSIRNLKDIESINKLQLHNSYKAIYFSDRKFKQYVFGMWNREKYRFSDNLIVINKGKGYNQNKELSGDVIQIYEKQLPYIPNFSFLEYSEIEEKDYKFDRRTGFL